MLKKAFQEFGYCLTEQSAQSRITHLASTGDLLVPAAGALAVEVARGTVCLVGSEADIVLSFSRGSGGGPADETGEGPSAIRAVIEWGQQKQISQTMEKDIW